MSKKSGQFSNPPSTTPFEGFFGDEENNADTLLTGHYQTNVNMPDISIILGDQHSLARSPSWTTNNETMVVPSNHQVSTTQGATTVPMDSDGIPPKDELNQRILQKVEREFFVTWTHGDGCNQKYTSAYVCPFTREILLSGQMINHISTKKDSLVWYENQKDAQDAAAARAMDCFELRERAQRPFGLRVTECPYEMNCGPPLPASVPQEAKRFGLVHNKPPTVTAMPPGFSLDLSSITSRKHGQTRAATAIGTTPKVPDKNTHPISALAEFYRKSDFFGQNKGATLTKPNFVSWPEGPDHLRRFTCALVCPISGEIFLSGTWTQHKNDCQETNDGLKWYASKKRAEGAAAAVAHDCYSLRYQLSMDGVMEEVRFCIEDPYQSGSRLENEMARLVPSEYWNSILKLQSSSRSGSS
ncbi:MAG: hypothetical protein SGBAC_012972 [Bacillariaceae sp.]